MTSGGSRLDSTPSRGCWFLLVAVVVLGLTIAAAVGLLRLRGSDGASSTPSPVATLSETTPYPSIPSPGPTVFGTSPPHATVAPTATPTQIAGPRLDGTVTGDLKLAYTGRVSGACPIKNGQAAFSASDAATGDVFQVVIKTYHGAGTYPVTDRTGPTSVAFEAFGGGVPTVYRSTTGTIHTTDAGGGTISADLLAEVGSGQIHVEGTVTCP